MEVIHKTSIAQFLFNVLLIKNKNDFQRKHPIVLEDTEKVPL